MIERLETFWRRNRKKPEVQLDPLESEFVRVTTEIFQFLCTDWSCRWEVTEWGRDEVKVLFSNGRIGIEVEFANWNRVSVFVRPYSRGQPLPYFDWRLRDLYTGFWFDEYMRLVEPEWQPPVRDAETAVAFEAALRPYAEALRRHAQPLLNADPALLSQMRDLVREQTIDVYVANWRRFVERLRGGFDGPITEYTAGVIERGQLDSMLTAWKGDRTHDPLDEIAQLDADYTALTEPLRWGAGKNLVLPNPSAGRWWRRPKILTGPLRSYFKSNAR